MFAPSFSPTFRTLHHQPPLPLPPASRLPHYRLFSGLISALYYSVYFVVHIRIVHCRSCPKNSCNLLVTSCYLHPSHPISKREKRVCIMGMINEENSTRWR